MARMHPRPLPGSVLDDPRRCAEVRTYEALDTLDDAFHVFYSVTWQSRSRGRARDGEADFLVAHPDLGLLVLEVKGGRIARGPKGWTSTDRSGHVHPIRDPGQQARDNHYLLLDKCREFPGWQDRFVRAGHGVVFPDCSVDGALTLDLPREIVLGHDDLVRMRRRIPELFRHYGAMPGAAVGLGADGIELLADTLGRTFTLRCPLGADLAIEERRILELTEQQVDVLDMLSRHPRVVVRGAAGTGKTVLAAEKARRLGRQGFRVLLTCFNRPLAAFLARSLTGTPGVTVATFNTLCHDLACEAGLPVEENLQDPAEMARYFRETHPRLLLDALDRLPERRFDAIVVDEAQDFWPAWWEPLQLSLADPSDGILYLFLDANQQVYPRPDGFPATGLEVSLTKNLRNTQCIHRAAMTHFGGEPVRAAGPEGRPVETVTISGPSDLVSALSRLLHRLIQEEGVPPGDIAILAGHSLSHSGLDRGDRIGIFPVTRDPAVAQLVVVQTVHRFKGLERAVVVLVDVDDLSPEHADQVMYVGLTRARGHVVVVRVGAVPPVRDEAMREFQTALGEVNSQHGAALKNLAK